MALNSQFVLRQFGRESKPTIPEPHREYTDIAALQTDYAYLLICLQSDRYTLLGIEGPAKSDNPNFFLHNHKLLWCGKRYAVKEVKETIRRSSTWRRIR
jgi:hypothetical protein